MNLILKSMFGESFAVIALFAVSKITGVIYLTASDLFTVQYLIFRVKTLNLSRSELQPIIPSRDFQIRSLAGGFKDIDKNQGHQITHI